MALRKGMEIDGWTLIKRLGGGGSSRITYCYWQGRYTTTTAERAEAGTNREALGDSGSIPRSKSGVYQISGAA
jgi:hypothetical protein